MMRGILHIIYGIPAILAMAVAVSCSDTIRPEQQDGTDSRIAFYMKTGRTGTKGMIEDTDALLAMGPDLYVTDINDAAVFSGTRVGFTGNGVWRSDKDWVTGKDYDFYGYITSPGNGDGTSITLNNANGTGVTITEPSVYRDDNDWWSDYLMSYRTSANGTDRGLVNLMMERLTVGVELYMSTPNDEKVTLETAEFRNINRRATFSLTTHHVYTPGEIIGEDMLNSWHTVQETGSGNRTTYQVKDKEVRKLDAGQKFGYGSEYRIMSFLAVPQPTHVEEAGAEYNIVLYLKYTVQEEVGSTPAEYETELLLQDYRPTAWDRGHRIRYYVTIDSSVGLTGNVAAWKSIDFIEGTLLPD